MNLDSKPKLIEIKDRSPNERLIQQCEKLLEYAKSGELRSIFCVIGWDDDSVTHFWRIDERTGQRRILGGIELAKFNLLGDIANHDDKTVFFGRLRE